MGGMTNKYWGPHRRYVDQFRRFAYGKPCSRCGRPMLAGQRLHLDHADDGKGYIGGHPANSFSHEHCNTRAGQMKGEALRKEARSNLMRLKSVRSAAFGIEVSFDRTHTAVVAAVAHRDVTVVSVQGYLPGVPVAPIAEYLGGQVERKAVVVDPRSPAANLIEPLKKAKIRLSEPSAHDLAVANGIFLDGINDGTVKYVANPVLEAAVRHAMARPLGGGQALDRRKPEVDQAPFVAAELAVWGLRKAAERGRPHIYSMESTEQDADAAGVTTRT